MSREKALSELEPETRQKEPKAKKKISLAFKASLNNKPSAKHKGKKKGAQKTSSHKASDKAASKEHLREAPPLLHQEAPPA